MQTAEKGWTAVHTGVHTCHLSPHSTSLTASNLCLTTLCFVATHCGITGLSRDLDYQSSPDSVQMIFAVGNSDTITKRENW